MKKITMILLALLLVALITGCATGSSEVDIIGQDTPVYGQPLDENNQQTDVPKPITIGGGCG